jgi:transporter family-2 protein
MKNALVFGVFAALITGMLIAVQATFSSRGGHIIGPIRTGVITNLGSGIFAIIFIIITLIWRTVEWRNIPNPTIGMLLFSGGLGVLIVIGASYAMTTVGVTAGTASLIFGQLFVSGIVDSLGWGGQTPIPFTWQRILGLLLMGVAIFLLVPKSK